MSKVLDTKRILYRFGYHANCPTRLAWFCTCGSCLIVIRACWPLERVSAMINMRFTSSYPVSRRIRVGSHRRDFLTATHTHTRLGSRRGFISDHSIVTPLCGAEHAEQHCYADRRRSLKRTNLSSMLHALSVSARPSGQALRDPERWRRYRQWLRSRHKLCSPVKNNSLSESQNIYNSHTAIRTASAME